MGGRLESSELIHILPVTLAVIVWGYLYVQIWGTCAGMILLSDHALKQATGGQSLVGGLDVHVCRNYFGSQVTQLLFYSIQ